VLLGLDRAAPVSTKVPLKEIGLDSLMAVELRNILVRSGGTPLPTTLLFDYPTLDALSAYLVRTWGLDDAGEAVTNPSDRGLTTVAIRKITDLSEEEAEAQLTAELEHMPARERV
jgi:hypothetical protein